MLGVCALISSKSSTRYALHLPSFSTKRKPNMLYLLPALLPWTKKKGKTSEFAPFGAGVTSYFKLLKYFSWSFLVVSFLILPHLFVNTNGEGITTVTTNTDKLSWTTVGNLGGGGGNLSSVVGFCCSVKV